MMDSNEPSLYRPLEPSERRFRLLRLLEPDSDRIRCEMRSFPLLSDDTPPWKALSYRWGDDEPEFMVFLNDHQVLVRKGLQTFLAQIIAEKQKDWYFIDALCINQNDDTEKSHQVQQMAEIYRRAEDVVVWIIHEPQPVEEPNLFLGVDIDRMIDDIALADGSSTALRRRSEAIVLMNSYWSRLWILQEVLLAKQLTFRLGNDKFKYEGLCSLEEETEADHIRLSTKKYRSSNVIVPWHTPFFDNMRRSREILFYRGLNTKLLRTGKLIPFHEAVDCFSLQCCSRPHDKVYAYLGLTNSRIQVDYSTPILDLFVATLADYLLSAGFTKDLTFLQFFRVQPGLALDGMAVPLMLFELDPCEPVVQLLIREAFEFFVPEFGFGIWGLASNATAAARAYSDKFRTSRRQHMLKLKIELRANREAKNIVATCLGTVKLMACWVIEYFRDEKEGVMLFLKMHSEQRALEKEDAVVSAPGESNESRKYSQWKAHARGICEEMWQRFKASGEGGEADMDDESQAMIV